MDENPYEAPRAYALTSTRRKRYVMPVGSACIGAVMFTGLGTIAWLIGEIEPLFVQVVVIIVGTSVLCTVVVVGITLLRWLANERDEGQND